MSALFQKRKLLISVWIEMTLSGLFVEVCQEDKFVWECCWYNWKDRRFKSLQTRDLPWRYKMWKASPKQLVTTFQRQMGYQVIVIQFVNSTFTLYSDVFDQKKLFFEIWFWNLYLIKCKLCGQWSHCRELLSTILGNIKR